MRPANLQNSQAIRIAASRCQNEWRRPRPGRRLTGDRCVVSRWSRFDTFNFASDGRLSGVVVSGLLRGGDTINWHILAADCGRFDKAFRPFGEPAKRPALRRQEIPPCETRPDKYVQLLCGYPRPDNRLTVPGFVWYLWYSAAEAQSIGLQSCCTSCPSREWTGEMESGPLFGQVLRRK